MKAGREPIVPLTDHACRIIKRCWQLRCEGADLIFDGAKHGTRISDMTLVKVLRDMEEPFTPHGFRSAFRDWASETTDFPDRVVEAALAHAVKEKTEAAYRRGALLENGAISWRRGATTAQSVRNRRSAVSVGRR